MWVYCGAGRKCYYKNWRAQSSLVTMLTSLQCSTDIFDITAPQLFLHTLSIWMDGVDKEFKEMHTQMLEERCLKVQVYSSPPTLFWQWNGGCGCVCHNLSHAHFSLCRARCVVVKQHLNISVKVSSFILYKAISVTFQMNRWVQHYEHLKGKTDWKNINFSPRLNLILNTCSSV